MYNKFHAILEYIVVKLVLNQCSARRKGYFRNMVKHLKFTPPILGLLAAASVAIAEGSGGDADLAQELTNPIANLVTIPIQMNFDNNIGLADEGTKITTNVQPVIPFEVNDDWNLITRTIVPIIHQEDIFPASGSQFGLGDINTSLFFSPKAPTSGGLHWGAGPVLLLPTATDSKIGASQC